MTFQERLNQAIAVVGNSPHTYDKEIFIIRETDYKRKPPLPFFGSFSMTTSVKQVWLARDWADWFNPYLPPAPDGFIQASNLIHECCHQQQRMEQGAIAFSTRWLLQRAGRYQLEIEAYRKQIKWIIDFLQLGSVAQIQTFIAGIAQEIYNDYLLFGYRQLSEIIADLNA